MQYVNPNFRSILTACAAIVVTAIVFGCSPPRPRPDATHPDVIVKLPAIVQAAEAGDTTVIPRLIGDLGDSDPAIRFFAIEALYRLTGQRLGYDYYGADAERQEATDRWRQWLEEQREEGLLAERAIR